MSYGDDGHTALDSKVLDKADTAGLSLVLVKRFLDDGREDLVIHASSNIIGSPITSLLVLQGAGFHTSSGACSYFAHRRCLYRTFAPNTPINLQEMVSLVSEVVPRLRETERALNNCGWSVFKEYQQPINEGHRAAQKQVLKVTEDDNFHYVMTYIKDIHGNARFVTHYIPKQGPDYPSELLAVMEWLEFRSFKGCPESSYRQCFYNTLDSDEGDSSFNRPADRAHKHFDSLASDFGKAYQLILGIDSDLREVGLRILDIKSAESTTVTSLPDNAVPPITDPITGDKKASPKLQLEWDVFICHATEDKDVFVRQLASELESKDIRVWYDEFTLRVGDSLRQSIEKGLARSRYGIVVLSPNFFAKKWPQDELNGLTVKERQGQKVILPVWLNVDVDYVAEYSPILADRVAAKASDGMNRVISDLLAVIRPVASTSRVTPIVTSQDRRKQLLVKQLNDLYSRLVEALNNKDSALEHEYRIEYAKLLGSAVAAWFGDEPVSRELGLLKIEAGAFDINKVLKQDKLGSIKWVLNSVKKMQLILEK